MPTQTAPATSIRVRVLGTIEFRVGSETIGTSSEALFAFCLFLTTQAGKRVPRQTVLDTFWANGDEEARRHAMRQMLYRARQKGLVLMEEGEFLQVDPALVDSDILKCLDARWPEIAPPKQVEAALAFGPTFSSKLPSPFLDWFDDIRSQVSNQARKAALEHLSTARSRGLWNDVEHWAKAVLRSDSLSEEATLALAEAMAMSGLKAEALEVLDTYLTELGDDDSAPRRPAVLLRKRLAERRTGWTRSGERRVPLVGRSSEMMQVIGAVDAAAQSRGRAVVLVGPPGIGKSRLLGEAREYASIRGHRVISLRAVPTLSAQPWSLLREFTRALLSLPGAAAIQPRAMETARALSRESALQDSSLTFSPSISSAEIEDCLCALLLAVSQEAKVVVFLDDAQFGDELSLRALSKVLLSVANTRCSIIASLHPSAVALLGAHARTLGPLLLRLSPLSIEESSALALATIASQARSSDGVDVVAVARTSGGNPLFIRELALAQSRNPEATDLPDSLKEIVNRSLAAQSPEAIRILRSAALLADTATVARVQAVAGIASDSFLQIIEDIASNGLIHLDSSRLIRLHDSWREAVLEAMPDAACAALALECATLLESETDHTDWTKQRRTGELLGLAGESQRALEYMLASLDTLLGAGLYEALLDESASLPLDQPHRTSSARVNLRRSVALMARGRPDLALQTADAVWQSRVLQVGQFHSEHLLAVCVSADCHLRLNRADRGPSAELLGLARHKTLSASDRARACLWGVRLVSNTAKLDALDPFVTALRSVAPELGHSPVATLVELIYAAELGTTAEILAAHELMRELDQSGLSAYDRCLLHRCGAHALRIAGRLHDAVVEAETAYNLSLSRGMLYAARLSAELICNIYLDLEQTEPAAAWLAKGLSHSESGGPEEIMTSLFQTQDRLALHEGRHDALAARATERLHLATLHGETQGKATALALTCLALVAADRRPEAAVLLQDALAALRPIIGRYSADFALELCLRASQNGMLRDEVAALAKQHLSTRLTLGRPKLAPACRTLSGLLN